MSDDMLVSYLLNEADAEGRNYVEQWINRSPENARYFQHFKLIWESGIALEQTYSINENIAWEKFVARTNTQQHKKSTKVISLAPLYRVAAIALVAVSVITLAYLIWDFSDRSSVSIIAAANTKTSELPDGSEIVLNKNSSISYPRKLRGDQRKIELKGEAFFKVAPDKSKPFVINVNNVVVTVVGTSFNIKGYNNNTEVVVETGTVKVEANGKTLTLNPGQSAKVGLTDSLKAERSTGRLYNYYITKEFVCDNTPLWKLVDVLNEAYGANIVIVDPELRQLPLTTTFHNEALENILKIISETFNLTISREGDRILIHR